VNHAQDLPTAAETSGQKLDLVPGQDPPHRARRIDLPARQPDDRGVRSHVFSYGHRNPQGLVFGPGGGSTSRSTARRGRRGESDRSGRQLRLAARGRLSRREVVRLRELVRVVAGALRVAAAAGRGGIPPSVPQQAESTFQAPDFKPPIQTFFTVEPATEAQRRRATPWRPAASTS
jgi:hypothetical protein